MRYMFTGLKIGDVQPHKFQYFTKGKTYTITRKEGAYWTKNDRGEAVWISGNNLRNRYFKPLSY